PPPRDVLAAQEIIAGVVLVSSKPDSESDNAQQVDDNYRPISGREQVHSRHRSASRRRLLCHSPGFTIMASNFSGQPTHLFSSSAPHSAAESRNGRAAAWMKPFIVCRAYVSRPWRTGRE